MEENKEPLSQDEFGVEEVTFSREEAKKLLLNTSGISEKRWERIRELIDFKDLVFEMAVPRNAKGDAISCPFHGRDSNPSFHFYRRSNDAYCFGCPPGDQLWDHIKFVSRILGKTKVGALKWLEEQYNLPKIEEELDEVEKDSITLLDIGDLKEPFIKRVHQLSEQEQTTEDKVAIVLELMRLYFEAEKAKDPVPMARLVGIKTVRNILKQKQLRENVNEW